MNNLETKAKELIPLLYERISLLCQYKHKALKNHRKTNIECRIKNLKKAIETLKNEINENGG